MVILALFLIVPFIPFRFSANFTIFYPYSLVFLSYTPGPLSFLLHPLVLTPTCPVSSPLVLAPLAPSTPTFYTAQAAPSSPSAAATTRPLAPKASTFLAPNSAQTYMSSHPSFATPPRPHRNPMAVMAYGTTSWSVTKLSPARNPASFPNRSSRGAVNDDCVAAKRHWD